MPVKTVSSLDGPRLVVDDLLKDPLVIPTRVINMLDQGFVADAVLRRAGQATGGGVKFNESSPAYADDDADIRAEGAEVPVAETSVGVPRMVWVDERALAVKVTDEMRRWNNIDAVNRQMQQVKNTMVRAWERAFLQAVFTNPNVGTVTAGGSTPTTWGSGTGDMRADINAARQAIETAHPDGTDQTSRFGFSADTLIVGTTAKFDLLNDKEFQREYVGNVADENLRYTGKLPNQILGLDTLVLAGMPDDQVIVMQRNIAGFIADDLPLQASELYRDEPRKTSRSDVQRASAVGLDQPKAMCVIQGVA